MTRDDIRLRWVVADPAGERAVDPLGMGGQADQIAEFLLPQLSVATTRARYFTFLCWAVRKSAGSSAALLDIHRLEAKLALGEARRHQSDPLVCPGVIGRSRAASYLADHDGSEPLRPERLYKVTAFTAYRPAMRSLGLLGPSRSPVLTKAGEQLAGAFAASRGRKTPCLAEITSGERSGLKGLLGLDYRSPPTAASQRRRDTFEVVGKFLGPDQNAASVLERHADPGSRPSQVKGALQRAFVWELLSCGLALAFSMLLGERRLRPVVHALKEQLGRRPARPALGPLSAGDPDSAGHVVALLRTATHFRPAEMALNPSPARLAARLVSEREPEQFLRELVERHRLAKPEGPWISLASDKVNVLAPGKSVAFAVRPRSYRLDAFNQLLQDLRLVS